MRMSAAALVVALGSMLAPVAGSDPAQAQEWIQLRGRIQAVDCRADTLTVSAPGGTQVLPVAPAAPVRLNTFPVELCALRPFVGSVVIARVTPVASQMIAGRVDVFSAASAVAPPPVYYPCCPFYPGFAGFPGIGIGVGFRFGPGSYPAPDREDR